VGKCFFAQGGGTTGRLVLFRKGQGDKLTTRNDKNFTLKQNVWCNRFPRIRDMIALDKAPTERSRDVTSGKNKMGRVLLRTGRKSDRKEERGNQRRKREI